MKTNGEIRIIIYGMMFRLTVLQVKSDGTYISLTVSKGEASLIGHDLAWFKENCTSKSTVVDRIIYY